jgi:hypothetical protein
LLYPDISDDAFLKKLLKKREFRETKQAKITDETLQDNVCEVEEFEYTSAQKFVSQFMSPNTPYNGMLLYHGVGVGKTCSAVLTAEAFLQLSPKNKVFILAPPAIQAGFYRTIFDSTRIKFGLEPEQQNVHEGCTGNRYLELTQTLFERDKKDIELRVNRLINKRYSIMGYVAFRNMVRDILRQIPSTLSPERKQEQKMILLQKAFGGSLLVIDEAHNLRDVGETDLDLDQSDDVGERSDAAAGKKLTPMLREVLETCDGNKLMMMSATPMYNDYREIISLLNLLLLVDKVDKSELLTESDIKFVMTENGETLSEESENRLMQIANGHVSFMRGENPKAFPARLDPSEDIRVSSWPGLSPNGVTQIPNEQKGDVLRLPLVDCKLHGDSLEVIRSNTERLLEGGKGLGIRTIDTMLQAGNCIFPGEGNDGRYGTEGFQSWFTVRAAPATFEGTRLSLLPQYVPANPDESYNWMIASEDGLGKVSPKFNRVLDSIRSSVGLSFVYSRFVENGAVIFSLFLEANGYTPWGRSAPLFHKGALPGSGGRQCSKCHKKEVGHPGFFKEQPETRENHAFMPAYYALLTASDVNTVEKSSLPLSPNNTAVINAARHIDNKNGNKIKVIVGSQVAGEGLDLKYIREVHILEGWFHLSKEEQIVGRGIRYCSHNALHKSMRNCTINLYVNTYPEDVGKETIDMYSYRTAMNKAVRMGNVSRALKRGASDCNLNRDAIMITGLKSIQMIDSQGQDRLVNLNDKDFTPVCDWIRCSYECKPALNLSNKMDMPDDNGTYDMFAARFSEQKLIYTLKKMFKMQPWYHWDNLKATFKDIPEDTLRSLLLRVVTNQSLIFENGDLQGHIIFRNNLFLFQPNKIQDNAIPISFRLGKYPVKRDSYYPAMLKDITALKTQAPVVQAVQTVEGVESDKVEESSVELAIAFWNESMKWLDSWISEETIIEGIPQSLKEAINAYVEGDTKKAENFETRMTKLQWWGHEVKSIEGGLKDLKQVAKEFIWDSFLKGPEQVAMLDQKIPLSEDGGSEQYISAGAVKATRYMDILTKQPIYFCGGSNPCPPSILKFFTDSKTDTVITARANTRFSGSLYGFMVVWENAIMFKTNNPKPEGKEPGSGAACSIVSNVKGHRMKLIELGDMLGKKYDKANKFHLTEEDMSKGSKKLTGAPSFCALMEIVLRWMDVRKDKHGGLRYFYRPLSSYYSKHKSKK